MCVPSYHVCITSPIFLAIGDVQASADESFNCIVSVGVRPIRTAEARLFVELDDTEDGDLLGVIDRCVSCVLSSTTPGDRVLVHCHAGQSRSVAVSAALLMVVGGLRMSLAAPLVLRSRPGALPNASFRAQLGLLDAMLHGEPSTLPGFQGGNAASVVRTLRAWWAFRVSLAGASLPRHHRSVPGLASEDDADDVWGSSVEADVTVLRSRAETIFGAARAWGSIADVVPSVDALLLSRPELRGRRYCCGRCNAPLFSDAQVTATHATAQGKSTAPAACNLISVEPPPGLLASEEGAVTAAAYPAMRPETAVPAAAGHLLCGRCGAKAGGWDWAGVACACGATMRPAIFAVLSRVIVRPSRALE